MIGFDLLGAILRPNPRCLGCDAPATLHDTPFVWCHRCDERLRDSLRSVGFTSTPSAPLPAQKGLAPDQKARRGRSENQFRSVRGLSPPSDPQGDQGPQT